MNNMEPEQIVLGSAILGANIAAFYHLLSPLVNLSTKPYQKYSLGNDHSDLSGFAPRNKYGLIVIGQNGPIQGKLGMNKVFRDTSDLVYRALNSNGYDKENIFVLEDRETDTRHRLPSTGDSLDAVIELLAKKITPHDAFFMYVLAHGSRDGFFHGGEGTLNIGVDRISEVYLSRILGSLNPNHAVYFFNNCFAGGFAQRVGQGRNITIATSQYNKATSAQYFPVASKFTSEFFSKLLQQGSQGKTSVDSLFTEAACKSHTKYSLLKKKYSSTFL